MVDHAQVLSATNSRAIGLAMAAVVALAVVSTSVQAQPSSDVYAKHPAQSTVTATFNRVSVVEVPVPGRVAATAPALITGAHRSHHRPVVVEAPVTGREWAERQGRAGISAGH